MPLLFFANRLLWMSTHQVSGTGPSYSPLHSSEQWTLNRLNTSAWLNFFSWGIIPIKKLWRNSKWPSKIIILEKQRFAIGFRNSKMDAKMLSRIFGRQRNFTIAYNRHSSHWVLMRDFWLWCVCFLWSDRRAVRLLQFDISRGFLVSENSCSTSWRPPLNSQIHKQTVVFPGQWSLKAI